MLLATRLYEKGQPIYDTLFFEQNVKFQYPLTSLLPLIALQKMGLSEDRFLGLVGAFSWLAVLAAVGIGVAIFFKLRGRTGLVAGLSIFIAGVSFYPHVKGYALGQIQTFLTMFFVIACYCWLRGKEAAAGVLLGLMALVKPQYAVVLIWFALRKRFQALGASLIVMVGGFAAGLALFGWREQMKYLDVIEYAGRRGHGYYPNLSFNGLANRLFFNDPSLEFDPLKYAPYHPGVYAITLLTSVILIGLALWYPFAPKLRGGLADFCAIALASTAASPIAWEHHYGVLFPAFILLAVTAVTRREWVLLAIAYVLVANSWSPFNAVANIPILNLLQSVSLAGVLMVFALLLNQRREPV